MHIITYITNALLPIYLNKTKDNSNYRIGNDTSNPKLVGSITTFPARIENIWIVIESILRQSVKPDILVLWLSEEQFPSMNALPKRLLELQSRGLIIRICKGDLRSHKKYFYVLKEFPNADLFTFDDDIIYPSNTVSSVLEASKRHPDCVVGRYCNHLKKFVDGTVGFDGKFSKSFVDIPSWSTFIGSGGGTLYPSGSMPSIAQRDDIFMTICRTADDVWFNLMCRYAGFKVVAIQNRCPLLEVINKNNTTLAVVNYGAGNQKQINAVREFCIQNGKDPFFNL